MDEGTERRLAEWMSRLEVRHLADLTFQEVSRSLRALSSTYVERRSKVAEGHALNGHGKRAAFALFYGPLHFLLVDHIVSLLPKAGEAGLILDLGCGTGAAGAAWARAATPSTTVVGIDRHPWAVAEAEQTYRAFDRLAQVRVGDMARAKWPDRSAVLAAFSVNELPEASRDALLQRFISHATRGGHVLVVEPLAGFVAPWWPAWRAAFETSGGRADEWRLRTQLPAIVQKLDRASRLDHREITGRSLWI